MHGREPISKGMGMYWAQHGDDTYQCSPREYEALKLFGGGKRKYDACWSVYVVNWKLSYCDF